MKSINCSTIDDVLALMKCLRDLYSAGRAKELIQHIEEVGFPLSCFPHVLILKWQAEALIPGEPNDQGSGEPWDDPTIRDMKAAVDIDPARADSWIELAHRLFVWEENERALQCFDTALDQATQDLRGALLGRLTVLVYLERKEEAVETYEEFCNTIGEPPTVDEIDDDDLASIGVIRL